METDPGETFVNVLNLYSSAIEKYFRLIFIGLVFIIEK